MKAIILKELRENAKWALLMGLILLAFMMFDASPFNMDAPPLVGALVGPTSVGFAAIGLALGLLQTLQDRRRDRWRFIIHRPISADRIFFAKVISGVLLYVVCTALPLAAITGWIAVPGHIAAPFDWHMVLPRTADLLSGMVWYAAGLLIGVRQARWVGSGMMPVGLALAASILTYALPTNLYESALISFVAGAVLLLAAYSAFTETDYAMEPIWARLAQGVSVYVGLLAAVMAAAGICVSVAETLSPPRSTSSFAYGVAGDGRVFVHEYTNFKTIDHDVAGNIISNLLANDAGSASVWLASLTDHLPFDQRINLQGLQRATAYALTHPSQSEYWYLVQSRRTMEGYDRQSRRYIGSIGPHGFRGPQEAAEPFPGPLDPTPEPFMYRSYENDITLGSPEAAYQIDLFDHKCTTLLTATPDNPIVSVSTPVRVDRVPGSLAFVDVIFLATRNALHYFRDGHVAASLPIPQVFAATGQVEAYALDGNRVGWLGRTHTPDPWATGDQQYALVVSDGHGNIIRQDDLPPLKNKIHATRGEYIASACVPIALFPIVALGGDAGRPFLSATLVVGVACAVALVGLSKRYGLNARQRIAWAVIGLIFGLPTILLLMSLRERPARVVCSSCGRARLVTHDQCEHCGAPFQSPATDGTEVLEASPSVTAAMAR